MKKYLFLLLSAGILASCSSNRYNIRYEPPVFPRLPAEVVSVIDGDTVHVRTRNGISGITDGIHSVRMIFIDAPESSDNPKLERNLLQYFSKGFYLKKEEVIRLGKESAERLKRLLRAGDRVELEFYNSEPLDHYGRLLAQLFLNGTNVNYLMVRDGMADMYFLNDAKGPATVYYKKCYLDARDTARKEHSGIWKTVK